MKRFLSALLAAVLLLSCLPVLTLAADNTRPLTPEREITTECIGLLPETKAVAQYGTIDDVVADIRQQLVNRNTEFQAYGKVAYSEDITQQDLMDLCRSLLYQAMEHTGVPYEGDYLYSVYDGGRYGVSYHNDSQWYYVTFRYYPNYSTTVEQEAEVDAAVEALLPQLRGETDYATFCNLYDWLTSNVSYDYDNLEDTTYKLKYTAYAALIDRTAVCQGYACALYRLALELGIECRMESGTAFNGVATGGHAWNLVKLDGAWYCADATWDTSCVDVGIPYDYFLRGSENFYIDHFPDENVETVSPTDYVYHEYVAVVTPPTCTEEGYTTHTCSLCDDSFVTDTVPATGHTGSGVCSVCGEYLAVAKIGETGYNTLADALYAAKSGDTVVLVDDVYENTNLFVDEGVTLDLDVYDAHLKGLTCFTGSTLTAAEYGMSDDWGKLCLPAPNRLVFSGHLVANDGSLAYLPVWDPTEGCYVIGGAAMSPAEYALTTTETDITFLFKPAFRRVLRSNLFTDDKEMRDNGLTIVLRLTWQSGTGTAQQDFVYSSEFTKQFCAAGSKKFGFNLSGYDAMYIDLAGLTITPMIVSDNGFLFCGPTITGA